MAVQGAVLEGKVAGSAAGTMGDFGVVVALGVDMTAQTPAADEVIGKIFSCWFPIMAFVTIGFEHSVANMFFIPLGLFVANDATIVAKAGLTPAMTSNLIGTQGWINFLWGNLVPVTLGNIVGGVSLVAALNHAQVKAGVEE